MQTIPVWDLPIRIFHWSLAVLVIVCLLTGEDEGLTLLVHAYAGLIVLALVFFRLGWGVVGSRHARFADFVRGWRGVRRHAGALLRLAPERHVGHNPLGGWMVVLMLVLLPVIVATGVLGLRIHAFEEVHEVLGELFQILVIVHILGVLVDGLLTGDKLVRAMIHGRKEVDAATAAAEPPLAAPWRAVAVAVLAAILTGLFFQATEFGALVSAAGQRRIERGEDNRERRGAAPASGHSAWTISSVIFLASPNSIMVLSRKNSSLSTPA